MSITTKKTRSQKGGGERSHVLPGKSGESETITHRRQVLAEGRDQLCISLRPERERTKKALWANMGCKY